MISLSWYTFFKLDSSVVCTTCGQWPGDEKESRSRYIWCMQIGPHHRASVYRRPKNASASTNNLRSCVWWVKEKNATSRTDPHTAYASNTYEKHIQTHNKKERRSHLVAKLIGWPPLESDFSHLNFYTASCAQFFYLYGKDIQRSDTCARRICRSDITRPKKKGKESISKARIVSTLNEKERERTLGVPIVIVLHIRAFLNSPSFERASI